MPPPGVLPRGVQKGRDPGASLRSLLRGTACRKRNLRPATLYEFRVRAQNKVGWGRHAEGP